MTDEAPRFEVGSATPRRGVCRGCGAAILWVETISGKAMPCEASLTLERDASDRWWVSSSAAHWAHCPASPEFRRRKARGIDAG